MSSICLSDYLSDCLSNCLSIFLTSCWHSELLFWHLSWKVVLSFCLSVCQSVFRHVFLTFWHPVDILNNFGFDKKAEKLKQKNCTSSPAMDIRTYRAAGQPIRSHCTSLLFPITNNCRHISRHITKQKHASPSLHAAAGGREIMLTTLPGGWDG